MVSKYTNEFRTGGYRGLEGDIIQYLPLDIGNILKRINPIKLTYIEEIRLRAGKPLMVMESSCDWFVDIDGKLADNQSDAYVVKHDEIVKTLELMSENSIYAYQDEIRNGFITLKGGHRVGIAGKVVLEKGSVKNIKEISGLNIRISKEITDCSKKVIGYMMNNRQGINNTLIISPPQCGKTTIIRDISRNLSDGMPESGFKGIKVGLVDERSEIAACYKGIPQYDIGVRTDVLDGCPKSTGMLMMLRSMSPQVMITDEIGNRGDRDAVMGVINAGVKIITTAHGYNITELKSRQEVLDLIENRIFDVYIVLSGACGPGTLEEVIDGSGTNAIYRRMK